MDNRLKNFAFLAIVMGCYPLFLLMISVFRLPNGMAWQLTLVSAAAVLFSRLLGYLVYRFEHRSRILGMAAATAGSLLLGTVVLLSLVPFMERRAAVLFGICASFVCFTVWKHRNILLQQLVGSGTFLILAALHFLVLLYTSIRSEDSLQECCISMLLFSVAYGCLRCMTSLVAASPSQTSATAAGHNARLYAAYAAIGLLPLLFGRYAVQFVRSGLRMLGKMVLSFFRWLSTLTGTESEVYQGEQAMQPVQGEAQSDAWIMAILELFWLILILVLVFRMRHRIAAWLSRIFRTAVQYVRCLFHGEQEIITMEAGIQEYADYIESIPAASASENRKENPVKSWKRQYRQFWKSSDGKERFRLGYGLWISALMLRGADLVPSDTPDEICQKAESYDDPTMSSTVTQAYYLVRYGEHTPDANAMENLEALLVHNAGTLRGKR